MVHGELYFLCNAALCACALPLGGKLAGLPAPAGGRLTASAALGGVAALSALALPPILPFFSLPAGVWLCFGSRGLQACVRCLFTTLGATLLSGGAVSCLLSSGAAPLLAVFSGMALSLLLYMLSTLLPATLCEVRQVELFVGGSSVLLPAMLDSGNMLRDPITARPVLVIPRKAARVLFPDFQDRWETENLPSGFRLLSVRTAAGGGLLPMFHPDGCRLYINGRTYSTELNVVVADCQYRGVQALVPMAALPADASLK
ncbi:MAG: sigma-E processing peptidase SpoIIGA [Eubacteriales bacterium]|nr:sigma-E processing peptidase SpoIIGA [Eubacteriales bacterium]